MGRVRAGVERVVPASVLARLGRTRGSAPSSAGRGGAYTIELEYPLKPLPRFGYERPAHPELERIIGAGRDRYAATLRGLAELRDSLLAIPLLRGDPHEPWWHNGWYSGLDAVSLYGFLAYERPARYLEIGSGNSTKYARRAITDHGLPTTVTSIDPQPRAEIDQLCDQVVRAGLEDVPLDVFDQVEAGDMVFMDGSHRTFMNSDATVFFTEVLPRLPAGVLVHVHDVFLPWDYPPQIAGWHWSEQYLLACWLLAGGPLEIALPNFYVSLEPELHHLLDPLWDRFVWSHTATNGVGFWFRTTPPLGARSDR